MKLVIGTVMALALSTVSFANDHAAEGHCKNAKGEVQKKVKTAEECAKTEGNTWEAKAPAEHK